MTVLPTLQFTGQDELLDLPISDNELRTATIQLPEGTGATSKLVTVEKISNHKWPEPGPDQRILCTSKRYIAYVVTARTSAIIKITEKEDLGKTTKIKDIKGKILRFMFKNAPSDVDGHGDEIFAVLSVEDTRQLWLSVYEIVLSVKGSVNNIEVCKRLLCENVPQGITPVLAIQPSLQYPNIIAVAVDSQVYFVTIDDSYSQTMKNFGLPVETQIVSIHVAIDDNATIAACSKDGTLVFYNPHDETLMDDPYHLFEKENVVVNWIGFPDDCEDSDNVWKHLIVATETKIAIFTLEQWSFSYVLNLQLPEDQDISLNMRYSLDDRGKFLVISSQNSHFLYVLMLKQTQGYSAPDAFSRMFCYPMKSGLYDLSISAVVKEENVQGRYENSSVVHTILLIAISNSAMYKCKVVFDTGYKCSNSSEPKTVPLQSSETPHYPNPPSSAPALHSLLSSPVSTRSLSSSSQPILLSPSSFTSTVTLTTPLPISKLVPSLPTVHGLVSLSSDLPKIVPKSSSYHSGLSGGDDELMPTPLATPAGQERNWQDTTNHELVDLLQRIYILGSESTCVENFEATLFGSPLTSEDACDDAEFYEWFTAFYSNGITNWPDIHPTVLNQVIAKHLLIKTVNPAVVRDIASELPPFGEDLIAVLMMLTGMMFSAPSWHLALAHFAVIRDIIHVLYNNSLPDALTSRNMMLQIHEKLVKSYFEVMEEDEDLIHTWKSFVRSNIGILTDYVLVKEKGGSNDGFVIQVLNVLEPLKSALPKEFGTLQGITNSESDNKLRMLMKNSGAKASVSSEEVEKGKDYNIKIMTLLEYLDTAEPVSIDTVYNLVNMIYSIADREGLRNMASAILDNYYSKDWFEEAIVMMCERLSAVEPIFIEILVKKISAWQDGLQDTATNRNKKLPPQPPLRPGSYKYTSGNSPRNFFIQSTHHAPLLHLINTTLDALLEEPANENTGSLTRDPERTNQGAVFRPRVGDLVACYHGYKDWRRGNVVAVYAEDDVRVRLVDYGEDIKTGSTCLRALPSFRGVPAKAYLVQLSGTACPEEHREDVMAEFRAIIREETLTVYPGSQEEEGTQVCVKLSDGPDLAQILYDRSLTIWTEDPTIPIVSLIEDESTFSENSLPSVCDPSDTYLLNLLDTVKTVHEFGRGWSQLPPDVREVVILKVRNVLLQNGSSTRRDSTCKSGTPDKLTTSPEPEVSSPSSVAPISSPGSTSPRQPSSPEPTRSVSPPKPQSASPKAQTPVSQPQTSGASSASSKAHSPKPQAVSSLDDVNVIPNFASLDIREMNKPERVQYIDTSGAADMGDMCRGLKRAVSDINKLANVKTKAGIRVDRKEIQRVIGDGMQSRRGGDIEKDMGDSVNILFDRAVKIFDETIDGFYHEEVIKKLKHHLEDMVNRQDQINFDINEKMKSSVRNNVTKIVKAVNEEVQTSLAERLASDESMKTEISRSLLPSFQRQLDHILRTFEGVLQNELHHHTTSFNQAGVRDEAEILAQLDQVDGVLAEYQMKQNQANNHLQTLCTKLEAGLASSVTDLHERHGTQHR